VLILFEEGFGTFNHFYVQDRIMTEQAYSRTLAVLGEEKLEKLKRSHILIAGLGGVGGYALEALTRMGAGQFTLVDKDVFDESNLNRQILCLSTNIGTDKVQAAKERVLAINPDAKVEIFKVFIDGSNIDSLLDTCPDAVVDAIDSVGSKCLLLAKCRERNIPVVSSMGAARRQDPTKVLIADISNTHSCPLAKAVRTGLRKYGITEGIRCIFSPEKVSCAQSGILGSLPAVVGAFGFAAAYEISALLT